MNEVELRPGLEGVAAYQTAVSRTDPQGVHLFYRGANVIELAGSVPFDGVWRLLVDGKLESSLLADVGPGDLCFSPKSDPIMASQEVLLSLMDSCHMAPTDGRTSAELRVDLARITMAVAVTVGHHLRSIGGQGQVPDEYVREGQTMVARLVRSWVGEEGAEDDDGRREKALNTIFALIAEHGTTASTFTARVVASTGASAGACVVAALSAFNGPRHGGAASAAVVALAEMASAEQHPRDWVRARLDAGGRLPGFGHRFYRIQDPRVTVFKDLCKEMDAPLYDLAQEYETAAAEELVRRNPNRVFPVNVDAWLPVALDAIGVPNTHATAVMTGGRIAGWCAHIVEQVESGGRLLRPSDIYEEPHG